jgi:MoaA/NifB/PqqE/SkfB family radical SAM enzyme
VESLPVVVLYPHSRCNCRCVMCDIWKQTDRLEMDEAAFERYLEDFRKFSVRWVVLSGGEPLMHSNLFPFCSRLRASGIRVTILSTGLLLERDAAKIVTSVDDVIVSLDGPPTIHDRIRRVSGAFAALLRGVRSIHQLDDEFPISARSVVQRENFRCLRPTARTAKEIGFRSISFLAADLTSSAFNRPAAWSEDRQAEVALTADDLAGLEAEIEALLDEWGGDRFLMESPEKLRRIALHYRAHLGLCEPVAPRCNAPWVSAVVEADGVVRPCFFHEPIGRAVEGLATAVNGAAAQAFRAGLDVATNPICKRCVCSLNWSSGHADSVTVG